MEDKNIKRRNETLKEIAEMQKDINDLNFEINRDICKIHSALRSNNYNDMRELAMDIKHKYPIIVNILCRNNTILLTNFDDLIFQCPADMLRKEIVALQTIKSNYGFSQGVDRGVKLGVKWLIENMQDSGFEK